MCVCVCACVCVYVCLDVEWTEKEYSFLFSISAVKFWDSFLTPQRLLGLNSNYCPGRKVFFFQIIIPLNAFSTLHCTKAGSVWRIRGLYRAPNPAQKNSCREWLLCVTTIPPHIFAYVPVTRWCTTYTLVNKRFVTSTKNKYVNVMRVSMKIRDTPRGLKHRTESNPPIYFIV